MANFWRDIRFGLRLIWKNPGFAAVVILVLAFGIGANTAIFSVVYGTMLAPMPYPNPNQLVIVWSHFRLGNNGVSAGDYLDWKRESSSFSSLTAFNGNSFNLSESNQPEQVQGEMVTPGWFSKTFGVPPILGRDFLPGEDEIGKDQVVILSHRLWERRFGGDASIIGRSVRIDSASHIVVGVLPAGSYDRMPGQLFVPLTFTPAQINHDFHWLVVLGRLKPNLSIAQAQADMDVVAKHVADAYPKSNKTWTIKVEPLHNNFLDPKMRTALWELLGAVGMVLLIACANIANLLLTRGLSRQKEVAVRASVGATRQQLLHQFLTESLLLACLGGIAGTLLGWAALRTMAASLPQLPPEADIRFSLPVLAFSAAVTVASGILFGCLPAWQVSGIDLHQTLKEGGATTAGSKRHRVAGAFIVIEVSLALTLLAAAGLLIHSFYNLTSVDLGVRKDHALTFSLDVPRNRFPQPEQLVVFYRQLLARISSLAGIREASVSVGFPVEGLHVGMPFNIAGKPVADLSSRPAAGFQMVTPRYYDTFGIRLVAGRSFTDQDIAGGVPVAMVNETFVDQFLKGVDPLTQRVVVEQLIPGVSRLGPPIEWQIVGVFHDVKYRYGEVGDEKSRPEIDVPFWQSPWPQADIAVRTSGDPASLSKSVAAAVQSVDPDLPIADVKTMDQIVDESLSSDRFQSALLAAFAGIALILAAIGIYGVMAFSVAQRTHEIGIRMALGAGTGQVLQLILKAGMTLALAGVAIGFAGAFLIAKIMRSQLYGIGTVDPQSLGVASLLLLAVTLAACYIPARHATRVDPLVALREE